MNISIINRTIIILLLLSLSVSSHAAVTLEITGMRFISDAQLKTPSISDDGSTVAGYVYVNSIDNTAVTWTSADGLQELESGGITTTFALAISPNGDIVAGGKNSGTAVRWLNNDNIFNIPVNFPTGISDYVGAGNYYIIGQFGTLAAYCSSCTSIDPPAVAVPIGTLPGYIARSYANDISNDGNVIVGSSGNCSIGNSCRAFAWYRDYQDTGSSQMINIGTIDNVPSNSTAIGVSADGRVIVGRSGNGTGQYEAFRWDETTGMIGLGEIFNTTTNPSSWAYATSADGTVIVGDAIPGKFKPSEAFIWTEGLGIRSLQEILTAEGVDLSEIHLQKATAVSADGKTIVVKGKSFFGGIEQWEVFVVRFTDLPIAGDVDMDGKVTISDLLKLQQALMGTITLTYAQFIRADLAPIAGDETLDIKDLLFLSKKLILD